MQLILKNNIKMDICRALKSIAMIQILKHTKQMKYGKYILTWISEHQNIKSDITSAELRTIQALLVSYFVNII